MSGRQRRGVSVPKADIMAVLLAMTTDLDEGSPAGRLYGDSLANALAVYLLTRCTTPHNVTDAVWLEAGFQNPSHFARTFRRFVGVSPSQFQSRGY